MQQQVKQQVDLHSRIISEAVSEAASFIHAASCAASSEIRGCKFCSLLLHLLLHINPRVQVLKCAAANAASN